MLTATAITSLILQAAVIEILPDPCMGKASTMQVFDSVAIEIGAADGEFMPFMAGRVPTGCHQDTFNTARTAYMHQYGTELLREQDALNATEAGYDYLSPAATKKLYIKLVKPWPAHAITASPIPPRALTVNMFTLQS